MKPLLLLSLGLSLALAASPRLCAQDTPIRNLAPTGDLTKLIAAVESAPRYPVFVIPLGAGYYDFELKASRANFVSNSLAYIFSSATHAQSTESTWDPAPQVFFCGAPGDARTWHLANPNTPLMGQIGANPSAARLNQVVFVPSRRFAANDPHLVWSYVRINAVGPETDQNGFVVFNPIVPSDWRAAPLSP